MSTLARTLRSSRPSAFAVASLLATLSSTASAQTINWANNTANTDALWSTGANWTGGAVPTASNVASFGALTVNNAESATVSTGETVSVLGIIASTRTSGFTGFSYTVGGAGSINLGASGITFNQAQGITEGRRFSINPNIALTANQTWNLAQVGAQLNIAGIVSGNHALTFQGAGSGNTTTQQVLRLAGQNTFGGGLTVNTTNDSAALNLAADSTISNGAIISGPVGTGTLTLTRGRIRSDTTAARTLHNSVLVNGDITIGGGTTNVNGSSTNNTGALTFANGGGGSFNLSSATNGANRTLTIAANTTIDQAIGETGGGTGLGFIKAGTATLTLNGANTYTGTTTVNAGTLTATGSSALGASTGALVVNNSNTGAGTNVVLNLSTTAPTTKGSLSGAVAAPSSGTNTATINNGGQLLTINQTTAGTYAGVIAGAGGFTLGSGSTAQLTLSGANTYAGATTINAGTLAVSGSLSSGGGAVTVNSGGTLTGSGSINRSVFLNGGTLGGSLTLAGLNSAGGTIANGANLTFTNGASLGTGTLTLVGTIASGALTVQEGAALALAGGRAQAVTINSGASLTGSGTVGNLTLDGNLSIGNSPGVLTLADGASLTFGADSVSTFEFTSASFGLDSFDRVVGTAGGAPESAVFGGTLNLVFSGDGYGIGNNVARLFDLDSISGTFANVNVSGLGSGFTATFDATTGYISIAAIPEPSAFAALAGLGALGCAALRRRRRA